MNYFKVPVSAIEVPKDRARSLDKQWAEALAAMFDDLGNKTAIEVRKGDADGYVLVAGLHRLEAAKICGWDELTVKVIEAASEHEAAEYRIHEVLENVARRELTILDRAHHLYEFQKAYQKVHPALKQGGDRKSDEAKKNLTAIFAVRSEILEKVGLSERSMRMAIQLWKSLSKPSRDRIDGTWLADHQAGLMALGAVGAKQQAKILDVLFDPDTAPKSVADAIEYIANGKLIPASQKKISGVLSSFKKLDDAAFDLVLSSQIERVKAWLERRGEI